MSYLPNGYYPAPQLEHTENIKRNPRSGRQKRRKAADKKPGRQSSARGRLVSPAQTAVLAVMILAIAAVGFTLSGVNGTLSELRAERSEEQTRYERTVSQHKNDRYREYIEKYAALYNVNPAFVAAIIFRESSYDPGAVSSVGARGLMQLLPDTGTWMADKVKLSGYSEDSLFDAETNIRLGTRYLQYLSAQFGGDPILVACGYHAGAGNVQSWLKNYSSDGKTLTIAEIPKDNTQLYAERVVTSYAIYLQYYYPDGGSINSAATTFSLYPGAGL